MNGNGNITVWINSPGGEKAKTGNTTDTTVYSDWYKAVYMPVAAEKDDGGVA